MCIRDIVSYPTPILFLCGDSGLFYIWTDKIAHTSQNVVVGLYVKYNNYKERSQYVHFCIVNMYQMSGIHFISQISTLFFNQRILANLYLIFIY